MLSSTIIRRDGGKYFSTVEIGKVRSYEQLRRWFGNLKIIRGIDTANIRAEYGSKKSLEKREKSVFSHAIDAVVIASKELGLKVLRIPSFFVWKRYQYPKRQIHKFQFAKKGTRKRQGGSKSMGELKKGDIVLYRGKIARVGGYREGIGISLHGFDTTNKRFTQRGNPKDCIRLFNQGIMYEQIPPPTEVGGILGGVL